MKETRSSVVRLRPHGHGLRPCRKENVTTNKSIMDEDNKPRPGRNRGSASGQKENSKPATPQQDVKETPANGAKNPVKKGGARPKTSSGKKKNNGSLAEAKKVGRQMRSAKKNANLVGKFQSLSLDSRQHVPTGTSLAYDEKMAEHCCLWDKQYIENPERLLKTWERICHYKLQDRCVMVKPSDVSDQDLYSVHSQEYVDLIKSTATMEENQLADLSSKYDSVFLHQKTFPCGELAVGFTQQIIEDVVGGKTRNGMAIIRPPGHHAQQNEPNGFCVFNNVALGARYARQTLGVTRILIVDWDVHHGQGTQREFYDDPNILYFSIHRYENGTFWPNLRESNYDFIGEGRGKGYNINVPLNQIGVGNSEYLAIFQQVLLPIAYQFRPEIVLVSAGYDSALGDEKGMMKVTPAFYAHLTHMLMGLADGKVCVFLEGGYCLKSLSEGAALTLRTLLGDPCPSVGPLKQPERSVVNTILNCIKALRPYWNCLRYQGNLDPGQPSEVEDIFHTHEDEEKPDRYKLTNCYPVLPKETNMFLDWQLEQLVKETNLAVPPDRTCLVYDEAMRKHRNAVYNGHPERPDRISRIFDKHEEYKLLDRVVQLKSRSATTEELELVHRLAYIEEIQCMKNMKPRDLIDLEDRYNSVYLSQDAHECASLAAGSLLNVVDHVLTGQCQNGLGIIRPPGHHAESSKACGFCFFNSVAVAARYAQKKYNLERVLILDWDIHHGNGTQHMFEEDPSVLYMSIHRYEYGFFFPSGLDGDYVKVGRGPGEGFNVNIPWNKRGAGDPEYLAAFQQVIMPIAYEFDPELVLVSAGFDAARGDPLGGCNVTPEGYAHMTHMLSSLANGKVLLALEGGYNLTSISESMAMCTHTLLGDPCPPLNLEHRPSDIHVESICNVQDAHSKYWTCLQYRVDLPAPIKHRSAKSELGDDSLTDEASTTDTDSNVTERSSTAGDTSTHTEESFQMEGLITDMSKVSVEDNMKQEGSTSGSLDISKPLQPGSADTSPEVESLEDEAGACGGVTGQTTVGELLGGISDDPNAHMFAVMPRPWCPHLSMIGPLPDKGLDANAPCLDCEAVGENWVCLICYKVYCSRYVNEHMLFHGIATEHPLVLSYADLSIWCYACNDYIHNDALLPAKQSAHLSKFGHL
ncbi:histone deacetylase 6-like isoform X3 [Lineus longissimus]|uniref:histone deacetylase 6-like isoform X3 n=1 Tax=Lineus longissimus TaxID=88925 RepID=UPI002B4C9B96